MQFIFIDETGNSGFDLDNEEQPFHILLIKIRKLMRE